MDRQEIQKVLEVCAVRLEKRATEIEAEARRGDVDGDCWMTIVYVLRCEAKIIRAGCHVYEELPTRTK